MKTTTTPRFKSSAGSRFYHELKQNVEGYFHDHGISKFGNSRMITKSVVLIVAYLGLYLSIVLLPLPLWAEWLMCAVMGLAMAGIGMGVMHDANHGSYSSNRTVNRWLGRTADFLGVSSNNWINQHNKLHHTFTNIYEHDEDINGKGIFRFSPDAPRKWIHHFQHIYWVLFYGLLTIGWFMMDVVAYGKYRRRGLNRAKGRKAAAEFTEILIFKALYLGYMIVIPIVFTELLWWQVLIGFVTIHFVSGTVLSVIFQLAHVVDVLDHEHGEGEYDEWAVHQIKHTVNFATDNKWLGWYVGGLNFQVEHHLFPNICHVHYPKINAILKETATKHGVQYHEFKTIGQAFQSHLRLLRNLGKPARIAA